MKFFTLALISIFSANSFATVLAIKNCSTVEIAQRHLGFISQGESRGISTFKGSEANIVMAQAKRAVQILKTKAFDPKNDYKYKLSYLGVKYDAINIDMGGNGHTTVFVENTNQEVNFSFHDGDMYVNNKRCLNVKLPGDVQF